MKQTYSKEQEHMDLSLTETIAPLPELSQPETTQVQEKSPGAPVQSVPSAREDVSVSAPRQDIQPRIRRTKAPAAPAVRLPQRYRASTPKASSPLKATAPEKESESTVQTSAEAFHCNPYAREQLIRRLSQPQILLETPYSVITRSGARMRYRLEYGRPEQAIPAEQQSLPSENEPLEQVGLAPEVLEERTKEEKKKRMWKSVWEWVRLLAIALILGLLVRQFVFVFAWVDGGSMLNTLHHHEYMLVTRYEYYFRQPKRQEIVICHYPNAKGSSDYDSTNYVKRVIGLPGEHIEIREGVVYINGEALDEPYIYVDEGNTSYFSPSSTADYGTVPEGYVFVMGDHRNNSQDSRRVGFIKISEIVGHARVVVYPFSQFRGIGE